jgi:hypothetical protein
MNFYRFLLEKNGYDAENFAFLLFYIPSRVLEDGEIVFETVLKKIEVSAEKGRKLLEEALKCLNGTCPAKHNEEEMICAWCEGID